MKKLMIILLALIPFAAWCDTAAPVWVEADGTAVMSDADTYKDTVNRAKNDAMRNALEEATGIFIKSMTLVSNGQIADDLIYAGVRGKIKKTQVVTQGFDQDQKNLYRVHIRALVEPVTGKTAKGFSADVVLSKTELKEGDKITINYKVSENSYVYLFSVAADGSVTLLLPNSVNRNNYAEAGKMYTYPEDGSKVVLTARFLPDFKGKRADEKIKLIATREREDIIPLGFQEGMFIVYDASSTSMIGDLVRRLNQLDPSEWTEAASSYSIIK